MKEEEIRPKEIFEFLVQAKEDAIALHVVLTMRISNSIKIALNSYGNHVCIQKKRCL
jgi:D-hexose-6-phosphate mutarotase